MRKQASVRQAETLRVLRASDRPMTAYQVIEGLQAREPDIAPPTVYRTLAALMDQGRAHRLESLKAFVPCRCEHAGGVPVLAICGGCGSVEEHDGDALAPVLSALVSETGFAAERHVVEIHGRCTSCIA